MNKKLFSLLLVLMMMQSCIVPVKRDYQNLSSSLVFNKDKKWLINNTFTDLQSEQREKMNDRIFETFQKLSHQNAYRINQAQQENLLPGRIPFSPSTEDLEALKNNSNFDYLVNSYTQKVKDQIAGLETELPLQYSKNEAFAIIEIYDLKTLKRIYFQKASSETSLDAKKTYPKYSGEEVYQIDKNGKDSGPYFSYSAGQLSIKNMKKILKDIEKKAVK